MVKIGIAPKGRVRNAKKQHEKRIRRIDSQVSAHRGTRRKSLR